MNSLDTKKLQWMQENIKEGFIAIDIGACIGLFTRPIAELVGNTGLVYAFEPRSDNFAQLTKNLQGKGNVILMNIGLSDSNLEKVPFYIRDDHIGWNSFEKNVHYIVDKCSRIEYVDLFTLDSILLSAGIKKVNFIKIDVEGYDLKVLHGALNTITSINNTDISILMEVHPYINTATDFFSFFKKYGFNVYNFETMHLVERPEQLTTEVLLERKL